LKKISRIRLSGEEQYLALGQKAFDGDGCVDSVHVRHDHVGNDQIRSQLRGTADSFSTGISSDSIEPRLRQNNYEGIGYGVLVVNN
jgi:hypothetical protein